MGGCYHCGSWTHYAQYPEDCRAARQLKETVAADLREQIGKVKAPPEGSVLRFDHRDSMYAALFIGGKWYVTGNVLLGRHGPYTHSRMLSVLAEASNIRLATGWETV